jgi:hypothetical protein
MISSNCAFSQVIGKTSDFKRFVRNPEAWPKASRMLFSLVMSCVVGLTKMVVSFTYKDVLIPLALAEIGWRIPFSVATFMSL